MEALKNEFPRMPAHVELCKVDRHRQVKLLELQSMCPKDIKEVGLGRSALYIREKVCNRDIVSVFA